MGWSVWPSSSTSDGEGSGTPVLLPGKSHGWRSLVGCSPWGRWESDMTERLHFHFSLSCIGEGNGNPLQCSCLENPRDGGTWWAVVYGVAQSRTRLKRLSSSSSSTSELLPAEVPAGIKAPSGGHLWNFPLLRILSKGQAGQLYHPVVKSIKLP